MLIFDSYGPDDTIKLGRMIAQYSFKGALVLLDGDLGAGKTTLTSGIALGLDIHEKIMSPTFNILKCYFKARIPFFHIDAYRLEENTNRDIGLEEFIEGEGVCVVEWPQYIQEWIPNRYLKISLEHGGEQKRCLKVDCFDERFAPLMQAIKEEFVCIESY